MTRIITKRRIGETVIIENEASGNDSIIIELLALQGRCIRLGITAPKGFNIHRKIENNIEKKE